MKKILALLLALCFVVSLAACGGSGSDTKTDTDTKELSSDATLEVDIWDNNQLAGLKEIADEWSAETGVKVNINVISWVEYWTLLEAGASGGEMPDVFWMHINEAQKYMRAEKLLGLNDFIAADDAIDLSNYYDGIVGIYSFEDQQYALPKDHDTIALLYNKSIFDQYGIEYPDDTWDWEKYAAVAAQITEAGKADGVFGTAMNTNDGQDGWYNLIYGWGGKLISDDNKTSGMDDPKTIEAMIWLADNLIPAMPDQGVMADTDPDVLFMSGKIGMMLQGSWMVNTFYTAENSADYAWAQIPYRDANGNGACDEGERVTMYNGLGWAASADTQHPNEAYSLISAFCSKEGQEKQAELGVTMAAYKGCSDAFVSAFEGMDIAPFLTVEESGTLIQHPASRYTTAWEGNFTTGFVSAWQNPETMADVCKEMADMMNEILATE
ncbi:MAG: sugar ABC transporter substrate-binding protein [Ruminococcus sp.]|nr:sugar ABC transporter substrate-binding protein [Ruminococcus sp.]